MPGIRAQPEEIPGDGLGNDDGVCESKTCVGPDPPDHDGDGHCEAGKLVEARAAAPVSTTPGPTRSAAPARLSTDDGCIHNVEVRNVLLTGVSLSEAQRWIIEDSEFHDIGCVNRGYGFDCPRFEDAPDDPCLPGYKSGATGWTSDGSPRSSRSAATSSIAW